MLASLPVVMFGNPPNNPVYNSKGGVVIPYGDANGMAKAIMDLAADKDKAKLMGLQGQQYVIEHHSSAYLASLMEKTLLDILE